MTLTKSEAGKLGAEKSKAITKLNFEKRVSEYNKNPITCLHCKSIMDYINRHNKFCDQKCSATYNNIKRGRSYSECLACKIEIFGKNRKYCDSKCMSLHTHVKQITNWEIKTPSKLSIKKYLAETYGKKCAVCGIDKWNKKDIVLELEHKDGNSENDKKENLCLICPNCHSQTSTYKGKNVGNGRHARRQRYKEGKSY